jgi:hypothetical protein
MNLHNKTLNKFDINILNKKLVKIIFKNLFRTSKRTSYFTIGKDQMVNLFKEVITVYSE